MSTSSVPAPRPFRFAVQATKATSGAQWRDLARKAEDLGYSTLFVADHYLGRGPAARQASLPPQHLAPIAAIATAAAVTTTLRVGCRVFCVDYHHPAVLAKEAATLDLLSDGRLEFGIGAGWSEAEYGALGVEFAPPPRRVDKLTEVVAFMKAHWSGDPLEVTGEHVNVSGYGGLPVRSPHPALMIGGGKRRVLSLAAREADIVSINNVPFQPATPQPPNAQTSGGRTANGRMVGGETSGGRAADSRTTGGRTVDGQTPSGQTLDGRIASGRVAGGRTISGQTVDDSTSDGRTAADARTTDNRTAGGRTADDGTVDGRTADNPTTDNPTTGGRTAGDQVVGGQVVGGLTPTEEAVRRLGFVREAAGDRFPYLDIESSPYFTEITDNTAEAVARIAGWMKAPENGLLDHPNVLIGSAEEIIDRLQERRETLGVNYISIQQRQLEAFAPIAKRLTGR